MVDLLTLPREVRDQIYSWTLSDTLATSKRRDSQRERKQVSHSPEDPETFWGEEQVLYPVHTSSPPAHGLLHTNRQLRKEFLDSVKRLGPLTYKVNLTQRVDKCVLVPTWIFVPYLTDRIDVLEVFWPVKLKKTSSIITIHLDKDGEGYNRRGDGISSTLVLLQRFIERGIHLLSKKKARKIHIGKLVMHMNVPPEVKEDYSGYSVQEMVRNTIEFLEEWMMGNTVAGWDKEAGLRENAQFKLFASKIDRVQLLANGVLRREWEVSEVVLRREEAEKARDATFISLA
ncbi:hypothetical protein F5884DRAFT_746074 [Xylogone sp. PMI_703]|nr:hypothetical protein F5884DRAFT_746074 [Xylogone sp. PMI_703]